MAEGKIWNPFGLKNLTDFFYFILIFRENTPDPKQYLLNSDYVHLLSLVFSFGMISLSILSCGVHKVP